MSPTSSFARRLAGRVHSLIPLAERSLGISIHSSLNRGLEGFRTAARVVADDGVDWVADSGLKRFVKDRQELHKWDDSDEADFVKALEGELDKICTFQEAKIIELTEQITTYENQVKVLIANSGSSRAHSATASAPEDGADAPEVIVGEGGLDEGDSEDDDDEETEDRFVDLEEDLANVIADVHDLGEFDKPGVSDDEIDQVPPLAGHFSHLNYTGFVKIVKVSLSHLPHSQ